MLETDIVAGKTYATFDGLKYFVVERGDQNEISKRCGWGTKKSQESVYVCQLNGRGRGTHRFIPIAEFCALAYEVSKLPKNPPWHRRVV